MRLGKNGEIIAETGFDGGSYSPRYASRTSVYLGDMSHEDIRIKKLVAARNASVARQDQAAKAQKMFMERQKYILQDRINAQLRRREVLGARQEEIARAHRYQTARRSSTMMDVNPWIGSPLAGFGAEGEQRINPDSNIDVEIVDADIPSVKEYGINNWMEDPASLQERVADSEAAYTPGKVQLATLVDYAKSPDLSVVGMPLSSEISQDLAVAEQSAKEVAQKVSQENPNLVKYGLYALAAYLILR